MAEEEVKVLKKKRGAVKRCLTQLNKFITEMDINIDITKKEFLIKKRYPLLEECEVKYHTIYNELIELVSRIEGASLDHVEDDNMEFQSHFAEVQFLFQVQLKLFVDSMSTSTSNNGTGSVQANDNAVDDHPVTRPSDGSALIESNLADQDNNFREPRPTQSIADGETSTGDKKVVLFGASENVTTHVSTPFSNNTRRPQESAQFNAIKLPQISLPTFDGNIQNWLGFRDSFHDLIIANPNISDINRFHYLDGALVGDAKRAISNIEFSSDGFDLAWEALLFRFNDVKSILENHLHSFFNLKPASSESKSEIERILDDSQKHLRALNKLGENLSDAVVTYTIKQRFDKETRKLWENEDTSDAFPTWKQMVEFLHRRCRALSTVGDNSVKASNSNSRRQGSRSFATTTSDNSNSKTSCYICQNAHGVSSCPQFLALATQQRIEKAKQLGLCIKCLKGRHKVFKCRGPACNKCNKNHQILLHLDNLNSPSEASTVSSDQSAFVATNPTVPTETSNQATDQVNLFFRSSSSQQTVLPTAVVLISDSSGKFHACRALLDSASQSNFISAGLSDKLSISGQNEKVNIRGLNKAATVSTLKLQATIKSRFGSFMSNYEFLVVQNIASGLPNYPIDASNWKLPPNLKLADPTFHKTGSIDILLGAEVFYKILSAGQLHISENLPTLQETAFGWVVGGRIEEKCNFLICSDQQPEYDEQLHNLIEKFWVIESFEPTSNFSLEEKECERVFEETYSRDEEGRFIVQLPVKQDKIDNLGDSKHQALRRFNYLENRFRKNEELKTQYVKFMSEYESLGHMKVCEPNDGKQHQIEYFLPHHAVIKDSKIRVVFDASAKSTSGISLNDALMIGPVVQRDLFTIILNFRQFEFVFTTDIEKMYRQIKVHPDHRPLQKIVWRKSEEEPIREYELQTVTYGTSAAPYLATKTLVQLAKLEQENYPLASRATHDNFYVDDLLVGTNSIEQALQLQSELIAMLKGAGMTLRKWSSNHSALLNAISLEDRAQTNGSNETIKTLGLIWNSTDDRFKFMVTPVKCGSPSTKREVLSNIAKLFDPLGLIAPVIVTAKILMQQIWIAKIEWDENLPNHLQSVWDQFRRELPAVNEINLTRQISTSDAEFTEIHGFADASNVAYGACIYLRSVDANGLANTKLVCSKSRVAPLSTTSIPRLELNAALLLARLVKKVTESLNLSINRVILWSDSSIVLSWLKMPPYNLKTYVANRVCEIQELSVKMSWRHVDTKNNAADILSRGVSPADLINHPHWFNGPQFLNSPEDKWPEKFVTTADVPEKKEKISIFVAVHQKPYDDVLNVEKYSSMSKLVRIIAWCRRIFKFAVNKDKSLVSVGPLQVSELCEASDCAMRIVQREKFPKELSTLQKQSELSKSENLARLNPFIGADKLLRVGGRLRQCKTLSMNQKHPILLSDHHITRLLIKNTHLINLHSGIQQTLFSIRQKYWIIHGKNLVKRFVHSCLPCFKLNPKTMTQLMGDLPESRIEKHRPFYNTGLDFCGPFSIRYRNTRKPTYDKVYICIFVCFTTKAVYLDVVEDASADAFLACLKRFFSRRGHSHQIWSDNGTNFVGAHNKLIQLEKMFAEKHEEIINFCASKNVKWKFIPPRAPHFGGIWESGVKVLKTHLKKVVGSSVLTLELLSTLVVQIEGVMNSRPISEMSSDPNDLDPITPGHFLVGTAINAILEPDVTSIPTNRLSQWQKITQMVQLFWRRFYLEYVNTLQQRNKWSTTQPNLMKNDIVIVKEDNMPSTHWLTGRVDEVIPGADGKIRCAIVRTKHGSFKRPITKLAKIPTDVNINLEEN